MEKPKVLLENLRSVVHVTSRGKGDWQRPNYTVCYWWYTEKNGFVTATKLGVTYKFFVVATKNFAAATKHFVDRTKHFVVTKYFCYPYFNKWFCWYNKTFYTVYAFLNASSERGVKTDLEDVITPNRIKLNFNLWILDRPKVKTLCTRLTMSFRGTTFRVLSRATERASFFWRGRNSVGSSVFVLWERDAGEPWLVSWRSDTAK